MVSRGFAGPEAVGSEEDATRLKKGKREGQRSEGTFGSRRKVVVPGVFEDGRGTGVWEL